MLACSPYLARPMLAKHERAAVIALRAAAHAYDLALCTLPEPQAEALRRAGAPGRAAIVETIAYLERRRT